MLNHARIWARALALIAATAAAAACDPTPPSTLAYPASDGNSGGTSSTTTGGAGDANQTQDPNNSGDPNATGNSNGIVASFFARANSDANTLYVVLTSDANFCANLTQGQVQYGTETQIQVDNVTHHTTYNVAKDAQVYVYDVNTCMPQANEGTAGTVQLNGSCTASSDGCSGSYYNVQFQDGTQGRASFYAHPCPALQTALPFEHGAQRVTCTSP